MVNPNLTMTKITKLPFGNFGESLAKKGRGKWRHGK
jgi:hypothetical protein